jgi:hypothetical protein
MAIFQTGAATSMDDLIDIVRVFALANGWTENMNVAEGTGRRVHLQKSTDIFVNLRTITSEVVQSSSFNSSTTGICLNMSTGFDNTKAWYAQPGAPQNAGTGSAPYPQYTGAGVNFSGAAPSYYLFARGNMIYCIFEYATGQYLWFGFGKITKQGSWAGGQCFFAPMGLNNITAPQNYGALCGQVPFGTGNITGNPNAFLYGTVDGITGWMQARSDAITTPAMPRFFDSFNMMALLLTNASNTFNSLPIELPISIQITRDGAVAPGGWLASANYSIEGYLTDVFSCNLRTLVPAQQLIISTDTYRVFPFRQKNTNGIGSTGWFGFAIKEN